MATDSIKKHFRTQVTIEYYVEVKTDELDKALSLAKLRKQGGGTSARILQTAKVYGLYSGKPEIVDISEPVEIE